MAKISDDELRDLFGADDVPHGPLAARWESPDKRAERYRKALEGILACAPCSRAVIMLQAVAARALGYDALERELLRKLDPSVRDPSVRDPSVRDPSVRDEPPT